MLSASGSITRFIPTTIYIMAMSTDLVLPSTHDREGYARPLSLTLAVILHILHSDMPPVTDQGVCNTGPTGSRFDSCLSRLVSNQKREPSFCKVSKLQP